MTATDALAIVTRRRKSKRALASQLLHNSFRGLVAGQQDEKAVGVVSPIPDRNRGEGGRMIDTSMAAPPIKHHDESAGNY